MNCTVLSIPSARKAPPCASTSLGVNRPRLTRTRAPAPAAATAPKIIQSRRRRAAAAAFLAASASARAAAAALTFGLTALTLGSGVMPIVSRLPRPREVGLVPVQPPGNHSLALAPRCGLERD